MQSCVYELPFGKGKKFLTSGPVSAVLGGWRMNGILRLTTGYFGTLGRNSFSGPGFFNLNFSLFKVFQIGERYKFEIRGESFGVTNTPQFSNPGTGLGGSNFGIVTGAGGGRQLQPGVKLNF